MSTTERVGIEIDLMGYEEAVSHMQNLDRLIHGLNGRGAYLKIKAQVEDLKVNKKALQAHKVKLEADASNVDKAIRKVKENIKELGKMKSAYENAYKSASEWVKRATPDEMDKAMRARTKAAENLERYYARMGQMRRGLDNLQSRRMGIGDEMRQTAAEIRQTTAALNMYEGALRRAGMAGKSLGDIFKGATTRAAHLGQAMQSAGNALTRMTYPMRMFTSGALMGAGYSAMSKVTEGLKQGFTRYDTMKKYPKIMERMGYAPEKATKSIEALNKAVDGMPTSLDEIVGLAQKYTLATGDIDKGTETAIAANNAFLASMATETERYQGMMQINDLLNGKKLQTREWDSLIASMGAGINAVGKELGYADDEMGKFRKDLKGGEISGDKFLSALRKVGSVEGELGQLARESMDTWEAFSSRIGTAFARMTEGVLKSMDELVTTATGGKFKSLNSFLDSKVIPSINKMTEAAVGWIKANPDKILDFFDSVKSVDWKSLGKGFLEGIGEMAGALKKAFDVMGGISSGKMQTIGKIIAWLPMIGNVLTIGGGFIKGGRHIIGATVTGIMGFARIIGAIASVAGAGLSAGIVANAVTAFKGLFKVSDVAKAGKMARLQRFMRNMNRFSKLGKGIQPGAVIKSFMPAIELIGGLGIMVTEVSGAIAANTWLIKKSVDNITGIADGIDAVFKSARKLKKPNISMNNIRDAVNSVGEIYGILQGEVTEQRLATATKGSVGAVAKDDGLGALKPWKLEKWKTSLGYMYDVFDNMIKIIGTFDPLTSAMKKSIGTESGRGNTPFTELKRMLTGKNGFLPSIKDLYDSMEKNFKKLRKGKKVEGWNTAIGNMKEMFKSLKTMAKMVPNLNSILASNVGTQFGRGAPMEKLINQLTGEGGFFESIRTIYDGIDRILVGQDENRNNAIRANTKNAGGKQQTDAMSTDRTEQMATIIGNVESMFTSIKTMVDMMPELSKTLGGMTKSGSSPAGSTTALDALMNNIVVMMNRVGDVVNAMNTAIPDAEGFDTKAEQLSSAMDKIKETVSKLSELGSGEMASTDGASFTAISSIKTMISQLSTALNTDLIAQIQADVAAFQSAVTGIFEALNQSVSDIQVTVQIHGKVVGHKELIGKIKAADSAIRAAVNSIRTSYVKNITITLNRQVNVTGQDPNSVNVGLDYRGGLVPTGGGTAIYRSKGGSVFGDIFKPKGTDTVPAMLTPGEYVNRKKAVDTFGIRFFQRINHLDVAGAFRELSARFGSVVGTSRGTSITNNITNNNSPTINQHINTNNPNFAFKRANRYVMAL